MTGKAFEKGVSRRSFLALLGGAAVLSACGFQLRGQQDYAFKRLAISGGAPQMVGRLERMIQGGSDTVVVKAYEKPDATLRLTEGQGMRTLSLNSQGVVQEYELVYSLNYTLVGADGTLLIPPSVIALNRSMTYSDQYTLAKSQESTLLYTDMRNDAVDQLTRRLATVRSLHPAPGEQTPGVAPRAPLPVPPL
ncbi:MULTISPECIES: LPS assembly lipoprotein LptE [unclassified Caballeronia]|uniref:LPS-assembly lipoprotein LptE n=1 Tax=unclassified Caballeronia TaxID=2646786 RepID=UPI0028672611|nr:MULTISPECIES: LPS assembly lipoprotein LptE [unclassified Caballeronia]MDR5814441.1 LPS assembly lipoprotein LptE [Caballeronia sp. LZ033]MDR5820920.1 LPS assembly lipoprotein LptE [Caballeronia sp. LZ043]MDR5879073.1 LPS assembly lipoprotein LptE [Caballeronia sp. LZ032]